MNIVNGKQSSDKYDFNNIPPDLRSKPNWIVWRYEVREGQPKATKIPYDAQEYLRQRKDRGEPYNLRASSTAPNTWSDFDSALLAYSFGEFDGIGFNFDQDFVGVDLDACFVNPTASHVAQHIINSLDSYAEYSPSGTGAHIICRGNISEILQGHIQKDTDNGIEIYAEARYFTMTGKIIGPAKAVNQRQDALEKFAKKWLPIRKKKTTKKGAEGGPAVVDDELILRAATSNRKFKQLCEGIYDDVGSKDDGSPDWSSVIPSMVCTLARYTRNDDQLDRILTATTAFQASTWRDGKWDRLRDSQIEWAFTNIEYEGTEFFAELERRAAEAEKRAASPDSLFRYSKPAAKRGVASF